MTLCSLRQRNEVQLKFRKAAFSARERLKSSDSESGPPQNVEPFPFIGNSILSHVCNLPSLLFPISILLIPILTKIFTSGDLIGGIANDGLVSF